MTNAKRILLTLTLLLSFYYLYTYHTEDKKYKVLNEIIKDNHFYFVKINKKASKIEIFENNIDEFSLFDKLSVFTQKVFQGDYFFKENKICYYTFNSDTKYKAILVDSNYSSSTSIDFVYTISLPIISSDNKIAMICISESCGGGLCGYSGTFVFRKENGIWKRVKSYNYIIS